MAVTGDFSRLIQLSNRMARLGSGFGFQDILRQLATDTHKLIIAGFVSETDPYGEVWQPRKRPGNGHKLLDDTGKGINSVRVKVVGSDILITSRRYMNYHLTGTKNEAGDVKMVPRLWAIKKKSQSLGPIWGPVYTRSYSAQLAAQLGLH